MSKHKHLSEFPVTMERLQEVHDNIKPDIQKRYGEDPAKMALADQCVYYSKKFMWERPIGCNSNFRMSDLQQEMKEYIQNKLANPEPEAPKAFFGLLALWVVGAIVSWIVQHFLTSWYNSETN